MDAIKNALFVIEEERKKAISIHESENGQSQWEITQTYDNHEDREDSCDICGVFPRDIHRLDCDMAECPVRGNQFTACEYDYEAYY